MYVYSAPLITSHSNIVIYKYSLSNQNSNIEEYIEEECENCENVKIDKKCNIYCCKSYQNTELSHKTRCEHVPNLERTGNLSLPISEKYNTKVTSSSGVTNKTIVFNNVQLSQSNMMQIERSMNNIGCNKHENNFNVICDTVNSTSKYDRDLSIRNNDVRASHIKTVPDHLAVRPSNRESFLKNYYNKNTDQSRRDRHSSSISTCQNRYRCTYQNNRGNDISYKKQSFDNSSIVKRYDIKSHQERNEFLKNIYLSKDDFTDVEVTVQLGNCEYYVYKLKDKAAREDLMKELQYAANNSYNKQPVIGNMYSVVYNFVWCRAVVISLDPVKVQFIDFGNYETLTNETETRHIEKKYRIPRFTSKIRLPSNLDKKYENLQCGERISIKLLSVLRDEEKTMLVIVQETHIMDSILQTNKNNVKKSKNFKISPNTGIQTSAIANILQTDKIIAEVQEMHITKKILERNTINAVKKSVSQRNLKVPINADMQTSTIETVPSIFDAFTNLFTVRAVPELKLEGYMLINESYQSNIYSATLALQDYIDEVIMITQDVLGQDVKIKNSSEYKPQVKDFVCFKEENSWYRGYVLKCPSILSNLYTIIAIDDARVLQSSEVLPCPKKFSKIFSLGITCVVDYPSIKLQVGKRYKVTIVVNEQNHKQKRLPVEILKDSEIITATIKLWKPEIKESLKSTVSVSSEFKSGSKICLTSYRNQYVMYARSLEETEVEHYHHILQRVAFCARTAPRLSELPSIGQKVIAPFSDGNNYRAKVIRIQDNKVEVKYIDFGNKYEVDTKDLQVLPDDLALERTCLRKIFLKDVSRDVPLNTNVDMYLRNLTGKEVTLTCTYEDVFEDGVYLETYSEETVNNKIKDLLTPSWKQSDYDVTCCMLSTNTEIASLGREGDIVNAIILNITADGESYCMCPVDSDLIFYIEEILPALLKQYSEEMSYYVPRPNEFCLVLHYDTWYRALCIDPRKANRVAAEVFLVDYGNIITVKHEDIRLMPKEHIVPPLLANMTKVNNLASFENSVNSSAIQQRIKQLVKLDSIVKIKIVECVESGDYIVELPDVHTTLIEEGLVSCS